MNKKTSRARPRTAPAKDAPATLDERALAEIVRKAKAKGATAWDVLAPIDRLPPATQLTALLEQLTDGALRFDRGPGIAAVATLLCRFGSERGGDLSPAALPELVASWLPQLGATKAAAPGLYPGWSQALDDLVVLAYAEAPSRFDDLAPTLTGGARLGLESVRHRAGEAVPDALREAVAAGFARVVEAPFLGTILVRGDDGLERADDDALERLALGLVDVATYRAALAEAARGGRPLTPWHVARLDAASLADVIGATAEDRLAALDDEVVDALLQHPDPADAFLAALARISDAAKLARTLFATLTGAKLAAAGAPIPRPFPLYRSFAQFQQPITRRLLARALLAIHRAFPADRSHAYVRTALPSRFPDVMIALAAHPEPSLVAEVLATFEDDEESPEARGLLLAAIADSLPDGPSELRREAALALCERTATPDPRWLAALDLRAELDASDVWPVVWAESRILLAFPAATRAELVFAALHDGDLGHAIQLLRVLPTDLAAKGLARALARRPGPPRNWLEWTLRVGGLAPDDRWTDDSLLAAAGPEVAAAFRASMLGDAA